MEVSQEPKLATTTNAICRKAVDMALLACSSAAVCADEEVERPARARTLAKAGRKMRDRSNPQSKAGGRDSLSMGHQCCAWRVELRVANIVGGEL